MHGTRLSHLRDAGGTVSDHTSTQATHSQTEDPQPIGQANNGIGEVSPEAHQELIAGEVNEHRSTNTADRTSSLPLEGRPLHAEQAESAGGEVDDSVGHTVGHPRTTAIADSRRGADAPLPNTTHSQIAGDQSEAAPVQMTVGTVSIRGDAQSRRHLPVVGSPSLPGAQFSRSIEESDPSEGKLTPYSEDQELDILGIMDLPGVVCNNCPMSEKCPEYKPDNKCAYDSDMAGLTSRNVDNFLPTLEALADIQKKRALRMFLIESRVAGGQADPNVTRLLEVAAQAAERVARYKQPTVHAAKQSISVIAQGAQSVAKGGGLIAKLMAGVTGSAPTSSGEIVLNEAPQQESLAVVMTTENPILPDGDR
jgi:hypothetical protein